MRRCGFVFWPEWQPPFVKFASEMHVRVGAKSYVEREIDTLYR